MTQEVLLKWIMVLFESCERFMVSAHLNKSDFSELEFQVWQVWKMALKLLFGLNFNFWKHSPEDKYSHDPYPFFLRGFFLSNLYFKDNTVIVK